MILSAKDISLKLGMSEAAVRMAMSRKSIEAYKSRVDDELPKNVVWFLRKDKDWYDDRLAAGWEFPDDPLVQEEVTRSGFLNSIPTRINKLTEDSTVDIAKTKNIDTKKIKTSKSVAPPRISNGNSKRKSTFKMNEAELKEEKLRWEIAFKKKQTELSEIKKQKERSELLPKELVVQVLRSYIPQYKSSLRIESEGVLMNLCDEQGVSDKRRARYFSALKDSFEAGAKKAQEETELALNKVFDNGEFKS